MKLAEKYGRYGYRRITALLQAEVDGDAGGLSAVEGGWVFIDLVGLRVGGVGREVLVGAWRVRIYVDA